jgi:serine/threonine protein kinase
MQHDVSAFQPMKHDAIPGYRLLREVGKGATGVVYQARSEETDEIVAVKVLHSYSRRDPDFIQRLMREADLLKKLNHPNIVRGFDSGIIGSRNYFVMEFVEGETLADVIFESDKLDEKTAAQYILQTAHGLDAAHRLRIVHRDIKPANLCLTKEGIIKIMDFGLSKEESDTDLTVLGAIIGTPLYISPEQASGEIHLDSRTDIYSLGVTFFHMLAGEAPFSECNTSLLLTKKITDRIPLVKSVNPNLSDEISYICYKMCEKNKRDRYRDPETLIADLENYLGEGFAIPEAPTEDEEDDPDRESTVINVSASDVKNPILHTVVVKGEVPAKTIELKPQQVLFYEDDDSRDCYILISGRLEVIKAGRTIAYISEQGSFVGEMSTLLEVPRTATIRGIDRNILLQIKEKDFHDFLDKVPKMSYHLAVGFAQRLNESNDRLKEAQTKLTRLHDHLRVMQKTFDE